MEDGGMDGNGLLMIWLGIVMAEVESWDHELVEMLTARWQRVAGEFK
jgi:hypothetical protein